MRELYVRAAKVVETFINFWLFSALFTCKSSSQLDNMHKKLLTAWLL